MQNENGMHTITRAMAQEFLQRLHPCERLLRPHHVERLRRDMVSGNFFEDAATPICFDTEGRLVNGLHRLTAFVESGLPTMRSQIRRGLPPDSILYIDQGAPRTLADSLRISGDSWVSIKTTTAARAMLRGARIEGSKEAPTAHELHEFIVLYREQLATVAGMAGRWPAAIRGAMARSLLYEKKEHIEQVALILECGEDGGAPGGGSIIRLRDLLIRGGGIASSKTAACDLFRKAQRAIKAFCAGQNLGVLKATAENLYPLPSDRQEPEGGA